MAERVLTQFRIVLYYLTLLIYPHPSRLNLDYDFPISRTILDPPTTLISILIIAGLIGYSIWTAKKRPMLSFCILWYFGNLVIESSIFPLEMVYEHRLYLPAVGPFVLFSLLVLRGRAVALAKSVGALTVVDAVHYALHGVIDCHDLGCDFLLCSAYKFFAPHVGVMYARREIGGAHPGAQAAHRLRRATVQVRDRHARPRGHRRSRGRRSISSPRWACHNEGASPATDKSVAARLESAEAGAATCSPACWPPRLRAAARAVPARGLRAIGGVTVYGPPDGHPRTRRSRSPSTAITAERSVAGSVNAASSSGTVTSTPSAWSRCWASMPRRGGLIRAGIAPYNTMAEVERVLEVVRLAEGALAHQRRSRRVRAAVKVGDTQERGLG